MQKCEEEDWKEGEKELDFMSKEAYMRASEGAERICRWTARKEDSHVNIQ
jgi:hypothetical protein